MSPNNKLRQIVSLLLSIMLFAALFTPSVGAMQESSRMEAAEQEAWQTILDAELSTAIDNSVNDEDFNAGEQAQTLDVNAIDFSHENNVETNRFIIVYKNATGKQRAQRKIISNGEAEIEGLSGKLTDMLVYDEATTKQQAEADIAEAGLEIDYIQPDYEMYLSSYEDEFYMQENDTQPVKNDWTGFYANLSDAHDSSTGTGVLIALIDGGLDTQHPVIINKIFRNPDETANGIDSDGNGYIDDISGWDFVNSDNSVNDAAWEYEQGHATHLAGILVGQSDEVNGIAPDAKILPIKVFQGGIAYTSDILEAIAYAEDMGANIVNCSWGSMYFNRALYEAMEQSSMLFVCAAGNSTLDINKYPVYPACSGLPNVISVSSVSSDDRHSRFSNYGSFSVDVAAPGYEITSAWTEGTTVSTSGTSQAAAMVSGQAALILSQNAGFTASKIKNRIIESGDKITGLYDKVRDGRRVNIALSLSDDPVNSNIIDVPYDEELPEYTPGEAPSEDSYEQYGAEDLVTTRTPMPTARHGLGVVAVDGLIYAIGGQGGDYNNVYYKKLEVYDPSTDTWTTKADMNYTRAYFGTTVVDGKIYVTGGIGASGRVEMYDPATDTWTNKTSMPVSLYGHTANEYEGNIYTAGGYFTNVIYKYDVASNSWSTYGSLNVSRLDHVAYVHEGKLYVNGGRNSTASDAFNYDTEEIFNFSTKVSTQNGYTGVSGMNAACAVDGLRWFTVGGSVFKHAGNFDFIEQRALPGNYVVKLGILSMARMGLGVAVVDGVLYIIGGINTDRNVLFDTVEVLEAGYETKAPLPVKLKDFKTVELNGSIYMLGGQKYESAVYTDVKTVYEYNTSTDAWSKKADMPAFFKDFAIASVYGKLYLIGGSSKTTTSGSWRISYNVWEYDPQENTWENISSHNTSFTHAVVLENEIYLMKNDTNSFWKFNPITKDWVSLGNRYVSTAIKSVFAIEDTIVFFLELGYYNVYKYNTKSATWTMGYSYMGGKTAALNNVIYGFYENTIYPESSYVYKYFYKDDAISSYYSFALFDNASNIFNACTANNKIYLFCSNSGNAADTLTEYVPQVTPWVESNGLNTMSAYSGNTVIDGDAYVVGGYKRGGSIGDGYEYLSNILYKMIDNSYKEEKAPMPTARAKLGVAHANGKLYAIGGEVAMNRQSIYSGTSTNKVEMYDPVTDSWTTKANLPRATHSMAVASYNEKIYVFGGAGGNYTYEYDPVNNTWTSKAAMPTSRYGCSAAVIGDKIYVVGGVNSKKVEAYDPATNTWETKADLPTARAYFGMAAQDSIYVIGGTEGNYDVSTVYEYNPAHDKWYNLHGIHESIRGITAFIIENKLYVTGCQRR